MLKKYPLYNSGYKLVICNKRRCMKNLLLVLLSIIIFGCAEKKTDVKNKNRYYYLNYSQHRTDVDTSYIDSLWTSIDPKMEEVYRKLYDERFHVIKYANYGGPADSQTLWYWTNDFGFIYYKNITWGGFSRLHNTNDSIDKILNLHCDFILSCQSLVIAGEDFAKYGDSTLHLGDIRELHKNN